MTMRIPRFAFVSMLALISFFSSSLLLVRARTGDGGAVSPTTRSEHVWVTHDPQYKLSEHMQGASDGEPVFMVRSLIKLSATTNPTHYVIREFGAGLALWVCKVESPKTPATI